MNQKPRPSFGIAHRLKLPAAALLGLAACAPPETTDPAAVETIEQPAFVRATTLWSSPSIPVCWENIDATPPVEREWIRSAVANSWEAVSAVRFTGWGACVSGARGIRIKASDEGPHTKGLGASLDGKSAGMVLNFTYKNWSKGCQGNREGCSRSIAVHEFGHALGFAHEQNRPDRFADCKEPSQGTAGDTIIGRFDEQAVMNYCSSAWNNAGILSERERQAVAQLYGGMQRKSDAFAPNGGWNASRHLRLLADVNGDRRTDVIGFGEDGVQVILATGAADGSFSAPQTWSSEFGAKDGWLIGKHPRALADVNGDRKVDVVGFAEDGVYVALSTGRGFETAKRASTAFGAGPAAGGWDATAHPRVMADVNADGKADVVGFSEDGVYVALGLSTARFGAAQLWVGGFGVKNGWSAANHTRLMADVNFDGSDDVVGFGDDGVYVSTSVASPIAPHDFGFRPAQRWSTKFGRKDGWEPGKHPRYLADVNQDFVPDIVGFAEDGVYVALGTTTGFRSPSRWIADFGGQQGWRADRHIRIVAHVDDDARADIIGFGDAGVFVARSSGTRFGTPYNPIRTMGAAQAGGGWVLDVNPRLIGDVNDDGWADIYGIANDGVYVAQP